MMHPPSGRPSAARPRRAPWVVTEIWERREPGRRVADVGRGGESHYGVMPVNADVRVGVVDVFVIHPAPSGWRVLVLQRARDTRCPMAWEAVHGRLEPGESPEEGALREVREETGLEVQRLYSIRVQPFYVVKLRVVELSVVFAAFVESRAALLGEEHQRYEWLTVDEALTRFAWPSERQSLREAVELLGGGDAGPLEDVLRVV